MYIARQSFTTTNGKTYRMGDVLTQAEYDSLSSKEKNKVTKKDEPSESSQDVFYDHEDEGLTLFDF